ncbi:MAG TPA: glycosyltransferase family 2 protein [Steroidobacteraceae bacterium]|nr:glycosyltransferase family 2 protein [Steroidobacteraceae bacterium]
MELALSIAWLVAVAWLITRAFRQRHALRRVQPYAPAADESAPAVAVIVPARDESANIAPCIESLSAQSYPAAHLHIIVVDDDSADATPQIVTSLAAADPRIRLLRAPPLPPGWKGKVHACCIGAAAAPAGTLWLCFLDADMRAHPLLIASAVRAAEEGTLDLLSLAPRHELGSFAERLMLPCGLYLLGFSQNLAKVQAPESTEVVATGQFMLARRQAYVSVGGHASVRSAICEDVELAGLLKRQGYRVLLEDGSAVLGTRMYTGWRTLWPGIAKNLIEMLGGARRTLGMAALAVVLAWASVLLPIIDAHACARGSQTACIALLPALLGSAAAFALHIAGALHFGIPLWYGLLFPLGYTAGAIIALDSVRWRLAGRVYWKGRVYE